MFIENINSPADLKGLGIDELMGLQKIRDIEHTYASSTGR